MWGRLGTWLLLAVAVVYLVLVGGELVRQAEQWPTLHRDRDFPSYYLAARRLLHGQDAYSGLQADARELGLPGYFIDSAVNPPTFTVVTVWLAFFPYAISWELWQLLSLVALAAAWLLLVREGGWPPGAAARLRLACVALLFPPLTFHLLYAHTELLLLWILAAAWLCLRRGKEVPGGILLGLAAALRIYPLFLLLYLLLRRAWKAFFAAVSSGLALAGLAALVAGPDSFLGYLTVLRQEVTSLYARWGNFSLWGTVHKLASIWPGLGARPVLRDGLALALAAGILLLTLWLARRPGPATLDLDREYGLFVAAALLASPLSWIYYQVLLYIPLYFLLRPGPVRRPAVTACLAVALMGAWAPVAAGMGELPLVLERLLAFLPTWTLAGLYLALALPAGRPTLLPHTTN